MAETDVYFCEFLENGISEKMHFVNEENLAEKKLSCGFSFSRSELDGSGRGRRAYDRGRPQVIPVV